MSPATQSSQPRKIVHEKQSTEASAVLTVLFTLEINVLSRIFAIIQWSVALYSSRVLSLRSRDNDNIGSLICHHPESAGI